MPQIEISWISFQQNQTSLVNQFQILSLLVHVWEGVQWLASSLCLSLASCPFLSGSQYHILAHRHHKLNMRGEIRTIVGDPVKNSHSVFSQFQFNSWILILFFRLMNWYIDKSSKNDKTILQKSHFSLCRKMRRVKRIKYKSSISFEDILATRTRVLGWNFHCSNRACC